MFSVPAAISRMYRSTRENHCKVDSHVCLLSVIAARVALLA